MSNMINEIKWSKGDTVDLLLNMNVKFNKAHDLVNENKGKLAVSRGPLLYCIEGYEYNELCNLYANEIPELYEIKVERFEDTILKNIPFIRLPLFQKESENVEKMEVQLIPYYSWNN